MKLFSSSPEEDLKGDAWEAAPLSRSPIELIASVALAQTGEQITEDEAKQRWLDMHAAAKVELNSRDLASAMRAAQSQNS